MVAVGYFMTHDATDEVASRFERVDKRGTHQPGRTRYGYDHVRKAFSW
jgi:hypothetical protein